MQRSAQALQQLAQQQGKAVAGGGALAVVAGSAHHQAAHHRKGTLSTSYKHVSTSNVIGNVELLAGWFQPVRKDFGFNLRRW
jgi:hypothetical protein